MTIEEPIGDEPRTRRCRRCDVEINAASARCPYCGARQFARQPILGWRGLLICLAAVAAAVLVTRAIVNAANNHLSYVSYRGASLVALVPSGYRDLYLAVPHGSALAGWADPTVPGNSETVRATLHPSGTPHSRVLALAAQLHNTPGVATGYTGTVVFAGGLKVWEVLYRESDNDVGVFMFDACSHTIGVIVTVSATSARMLGSLSLVLPQGANAICDGPDFSSRDRADTSVPLSSGT